MSMSTCSFCGDVYDTDFEMETSVKGEPICNSCWENEQESLVSHPHHDCGDKN